VAIIIGASIGIFEILSYLPSSRLRSALRPLHASIIMFAVPLMALFSNYAYNDRSHYFIAQDYVDNAFKSVEQNGMLLTTDWQLYSPSLYVREIEERRKDIRIIDVNLLRRSWYYSYLEQAYPAVTAASREKIDAMVTELRSWDRDPKRYDKNPALNLRINQRFADLLTSLVTNQLREAPVYVTIDLADDRTGAEVQFSKMLRERFDLIPQGLAFRVVEKTAKIPITISDPTVPRGFTDGTLKFEDDDVARRVVLQNYRDMFVSTGMFLAANGDHVRAAAQFKAALALDPGYEPAIRGLAASPRSSQNMPVK
jgi:hypothetical protein